MAKDLSILNDFAEVVGLHRKIWMAMADSFERNRDANKKDILTAMGFDASQIDCSCVLCQYASHQVESLSSDIISKLQDWSSDLQAKCNYCPLKFVEMDGTDHNACDSACLCETSVYTEFKDNYAYFKRKKHVTDDDVRFMISLCYKIVNLPINEVQ